MTSPPTPRPSAPRLVAVAATLVLACALAQAPPAGAQARAGGDDRVPSELWRTYPLDPSKGTATIERGGASRPARTPPETATAPSPRERAGGGERPNAAAGGSPAGVAVVAAVVALGMLASLLALLRFPAPAPGGQAPPGLPAWLETARRRSVGAVRSLPPLSLPTAAVRDGLRSLGPSLSRAGGGIRRRAQRRTAPLGRFRRPPFEPVRAVPDAPRRSAGGAGTRERGASPAAATSRGSEVAELKAKARAQSESKGKPLAAEDAETLKRKLAPPPETDVLKAKKRRPANPAKEPAANAQPTARAEPAAAPAPPDPSAQRPRPPAGDRRPRRASALRPVGEPEPPLPVRIVPVERPRECTIVWWRGYVKSRFLAVCEAEADRDPVVAASPFFRWRGDQPPSETPAVAAALQALVDSLELRGWRVSGRGARWFSIQMQETFGEDPVETEQAEGPETGRKGSL